MVKIRLQRQGKKKAPFYHVVVADSRSPRDGKIIEKIGSYDPMTDPATITLDKAKVEAWIKNGARPTDSVKALIEKADKPAEKKAAKKTEKKVAEKAEKAEKKPAEKKAEKEEKAEEVKEEAKAEEVKEEVAEKEADKKDAE